MTNFYQITLLSLWFILLTHITLIFIFKFLDLSQALLINTAIVLLILIPEILITYSIPLPYPITGSANILLYLFPLSSSYLFKKYFSINKKIIFLPIYAVAAPGLIISIIFSQYQISILTIVNVLYSLYLAVIYIKIRSKNNGYLFPALIVCYILCSIISFYYFSLKGLLLSTGMITFITNTGIAFTIKTRMRDLVQQFNSINKLNKKLLHDISRFKSSNDQCRKIIIAKEHELFQIARHASLAELTTGIAHELLQPLTGIKGIAQNMVDDINFEDFDNLQAVSELLKICSLVDKSSSIINHIRHFSAKGALSKKKIDLNKVILDSIDLINLQLKNNNIDLIFVLEDGIPMIFADSLSLEQLILNIILNARDSIIEKGLNTIKENGAIRISTSAKKETVKMIIEDNGTGIPDEILQKIWSPFFTTKRHTTGTGIGLSISMRILQEHDAEVDVSSSKEGTTFIFTFPIHLTR